MSRLGIPHLATAHPLARMLPAIYLDEDDVARRFVSGLDDVLAPVTLTLDCLDAYLAPSTAPADFLVWLASWVGVEFTGTWPDDLRRAVVAAAVTAYRGRGTLRGLARHVELVAGVPVEVVDSGGSIASTRPGTPVPRRRMPHVTVRLRRADATKVDLVRLERAVRDACPAHVTYDIEVTETPAPGDGSGNRSGSGTTPSASSTSR